VVPNVEASLWLALAAYRTLVLGYAVFVVAWHWVSYDHPLVAWLALAGMAIWTGLCAWLYSSPRYRSWPVLAVDLGVACVAILLTLFVVSAEYRQSAPTLPTFWASASMLAWAVRFGPVGGATAAAALSVCNVLVRGEITLATWSNTFVLFLAGTVIGYVSRLALTAEAERARVAEVAAAAAERERLARSIHDSVLQVLAWVQRRGAEIGGEAADLGRLAGEQERALRALVARGVPPASTAEGPAQSAGTATDLGLLLSTTVADRSYATFAGPATPVLLGTYVARETQAAVAETLDNVHRHAGEGAQAWVLLEEVDGQVTVTVRDDGAGMAPGRLATARDAGRLGVAQSIVGRLRAMGGDASVTSTLGQGTEVELRLPGIKEAR
jgi:signal transduction histidine kinase